jgi:VanZ family protein
MSLLFGASTDLGASRRTSRFLAPALRWLIPDISPESLARAQFAVRKTGHVLGYGVLAALVFRARKLSRPDGDPQSFHRDAVVSFAITVAYACSDEWHQTFTASRNGSAADVALDAAGAAAGLLLLWLWERQRRGIIPRV